MKNVFRIFSIVAVCLIMLAIGGVFSMHPAHAQGPFTYRDGGNGTMVLNNQTCWESSALAGYDLCLKRPGVGHLAILTNGGVAAPDVYGTKTLSAGAGTVTFATAFTAAPICFGTDQTAANAVKISTTTTAATFAGTTSDVIAYFCLANPN